MYIYIYIYILHIYFWLLVKLSSVFYCSVLYTVNLWRRSLERSLSSFPIAWQQLEKYSRHWWIKSSLEILWYKNLWKKIYQLRCTLKPIAIPQVPNTNLRFAYLKGRSRCFFAEYKSLNFSKRQVDGLRKNRLFPIKKKYKPFVGSCE